MGLREDLAAIQAVALAAVDARAAVLRHLEYTAPRLQIGDRAWDLAQSGRFVVIAVGKASAAMASAVAELVGDRISAGLVVTKYGHAGGSPLPESFEVIEAGHPVPDASGWEAAQRVAELVQGSDPQDRFLLLLSGGASALLPSPARGLTLDDLQATTDALLRSGAAINELNTVRKHLSVLQGGQLARLAAPAAIATLILSDVVGDPLDVIASGPTVPDPTTYGDALDVLVRYDITEQIPSAVVAHLEKGIVGLIPETPKPGDAIFERVSNVLVGSNRLAAQAAAETALSQGYHTLLLTTFVEGEAREVARIAVALARGIRAYGDPIPAPACIIWGGETTVTVRGTGKGGRNQELALAASLGLRGMADVALLALATDGTDGPTDAAGAVVDGTTAQAMKEQGLDVPAALANNDAYPALDAVGALLRTGPTGTNVNDLLVLLVR